MPPPNITGDLHLGHGLGLTLQDILIRSHLEDGDKTLYLPGTDHGGLGTERKIRTIQRDRPFAIAANEWKKQCQSRIRQQLKSLQLAANWEQEEYTLSDRQRRATLEAFSTLNQQNRISYGSEGMLLDLRDLAPRAIALIESGEIRIFPESERKIAYHYLNDLRPWNISRRSQWGIRIPGSQERFDTWFTSCLWAIKAPQDKSYLPAATLLCGRDILFFWGIRSILMAIALEDMIPFKELALHGLIIGDDGRKMSKSSPNSKPLPEYIEKYGYQAMRLGFALMFSPKKEIRFREDRIHYAQKILRKLHNAENLISRRSHLEDSLRTGILAEISTLRIQQRQHLLRYRFDLAAKELAGFIKERYCGQYLENLKSRSDDMGWSEAAIALKELTKLLTIFTA